MLNIGGELAFILQDIDYTSKQDLLDKFRNMRDNLKEYPKEEKQMIRPILAVAIQQAFYFSEWELMNYKKFCDKKNPKEQEDVKSVGEGTE